MATKQHYVVVAPVTPKGGKHLICTRRVGTADRFAPIAECRGSETADTIAVALNRLQGEVEKLEAPAQRTLVEVRAMLTSEREMTSKLRADLRTKDLDIRDRDHKLAQANAELGSLRGRIGALEMQLAPTAKVAATG